jgi:hypothetical protein
VLADSPAAKVWIPAAMPGFDELLVPGRAGRYTDRQNGDVFRAGMNTAIASDPHWVRVDTWNEYWENTYIEPSVNFGTLYTQISGQYLKPWESR